MKLVVIALIALMVALPFAAARQNWSVCTEGMTKCMAWYSLRCSNGRWAIAQRCVGNWRCVEQKGCVARVRHSPSVPLPA